MVLDQAEVGKTGGDFGVDRNSDPFFGNSEESISQKKDDENEEPFAPVEEPKEDKELVIARNMT